MSNSSGWGFIFRCAVSSSDRWLLLLDHTRSVKLMDGRVKSSPQGVRRAGPRGLSTRGVRRRLPGLYASSAAGGASRTYRAYRSITRSMARRQTAAEAELVAREHDAVDRGAVEPFGLVAGALEGADLAASARCLRRSEVSSSRCSRKSASKASSGRLPRHEGAAALAGSCAELLLVVGPCSRAWAAASPSATRSRHFSSAGSCSAVTLGSQGSDARSPPVS